MFIFIIKEVREEKGITQKEVAEKLNISQSYLSEIENNKKKNVSFELIFHICNILNVEIRKIYIAVSDIDALKNEMYRRIDEYGINAPETMKISQIIDKLVNLKMQNDSV